MYSKKYCMTAEPQAVQRPTSLVLHKPKKYTFGWRIDQFLGLYSRFPLAPRGADGTASAAPRLPSTA